MLQSVSYIAGALGVCVAVTYYIVNMRNAEKMRRREMIFHRLRPMDEEQLKALYTSSKMVDWETQDEFQEKYGFINNPEAWNKLIYTLHNYNLVGLLLKEKLISPEELFQIYTPNWPVVLYERFEGFIRMQRDNPTIGAVTDYWSGLDALYLEATRRYPKLKGKLREETDGNIRRVLQRSSRAPQ